MGATTTWERWDSLRPGGSVNPNQMTSFNHYAFGAVADWLHRTVGGIAPAAPGYRHIAVQPHPGGGLTYTRIRHLTPYGLAESAWTIEEEQIEVVVVVPPNVTASVTLPASDGQPIEVGTGTHRWLYPHHVKRMYHPLSLESKMSEFIDDSEAWARVLKVMQQYLPQLASHMDVGSIIQGDDSMTLGQMLSLLPRGDDLLPTLEAALAALES
jgi:alpha-L-rhamnosidase